MTTERYVYKKGSRLVFITGRLTMPFDNQVVFGQIMGHFIKRGEAKDITLYLNGKSYKAKKLTNCYGTSYQIHCLMTKDSYRQRFLHFSKWYAQW